MLKMFYKVTLFFLLAINFNDAHRILCVFNAPVQSHYILGNAYARGLAEAGHDVTMISPFNDDKPTKNGTLRNIVLTGFIKDIEERNKGNNVFTKLGSNPFLSLFLISLFASESAERTLDHPNVQKLLKSDETFDVIVVVNAMGDALKSLSFRYQAPLIIFSTVGTNSWINPFVGNPSSMSFEADIILGYPKNMNFLQRVNNVLYNGFARLVTFLYIIPKQNSITQKYFPGAPHLLDISANTSLVLLNSDSSIDNPVPKVPCMVDIGGFHIKPAKSLPPDLKEFMDDAKEGVIYFSMGSNLKSKYLSVEIRDTLLKVFGKLKQKVLWKWEDNELPGKPENVKIAKWLPQPDILGHPNTKVFITHGGLLSTTETIYHGVPIIAIPVFGDQMMNAKRAEQSGFGIIVPFQKISEDTLTNALNELLKNPKYRENARLRSKIMHDKPMKPMDKAIFWTEYVIRNNGTSHLRISGLDLTWYQFHLLDVYTFIFIVLFTVIYLFKLAFCNLCKRNKSKDNKKQKFKKN